jgi:hypothetical protein
VSPTVLIYKEYRLFFFSREEKRKHIHISSQNGEAKFWMEPQIELAQSFGFTEKQLNEAKLIIEKHKDTIINAWLKHFNS